MFHELIIVFVTKLREIELSNGNKRLYQLIEKDKLTPTLNVKLITCLKILYKVANRDYALTNINQITTIQVKKLENYLIKNKNPVGAESRLIKSVNCKIRNFHRNVNILNLVNAKDYCQQFQSLNQLVNDLVIKDIEFTNAKYRESSKLSKNKDLLYDSQRGRYITDFLKAKARVSDYAIKAITSLNYHTFIKIISRSKSKNI